MAPVPGRAGRGAPGGERDTSGSAARSSDNVGRLGCHTPRHDGAEYFHRRLPPLAPTGRKATPIRPTTPYRNADDTMFPVALRDQRLAVKEQVFGLVLNGAAKAYPRYLLEQSPVLNDTVGTDSVVIVTAGPGAGPRAYLRGGNVFRAASPRADGGPPVVLDESGAEWTVSEDCAGQLPKRRPTPSSPAWQGRVLVRLVRLLPRHRPLFPLVARRHAGLVFHRTSVF